MPEGHLIRIAADKQDALFAGKTVKSSSPQGRFERADELGGKRLKRAEGYGKQMFYHFPAGRIVQVHLGRLGKFVYHGPKPPEPRPSVRWRLTTPAATLDLIAPITCGLVTPGEREAILAKLGPDPLHPDFDEAAAREHVFGKIAKSRKAIGALLLDQSLFAGTGNIFRAEALLRIGLHPATPGNAVGRARFDLLWDDLILLLHRAVEHGKIIGTDRDEVGKPLSKVTADERFLIYKRDTCRRCGAKAQELKLAGRPIRFCPKHQAE
jgi:formamidopyrimidine-DNA glycosylase